MKVTMGMMASLFCLWSAFSGEIVVQKVQGSVDVRQGVTETWNAVAAGDVLRPDDTMKTGSRGSAVLLVHTGHSGTKKIVLPHEVIVDMSDIRDLTQEELMLKLTMEKVRSSSYQWKKDEIQIPNAAVVHGADRRTDAPVAENEIATGVLQLNGTRVLFDNGFYSTCALKAMEVFRLYPLLAHRFENRLLVAEALEKAHLRGEALSEYGAILRLENLTGEQQDVVRTRMADLRK